MGSELLHTDLISIIMPAPARSAATCVQTESFVNKFDMFQEFVSDSRLGKVIEQLKRSNDIFNIISPTENQHSDILRWLFNPREGHGQGDAILKDFLIAAYWAAPQNVYSNRAFFEHWTPSRITSTGFHSVFLIREYRLSNGKRLDLLMVDTDNEMLVVVENKHGSNVGETQLDDYYSGVAAELRQRPAFNGFKTAYIVLDRKYSNSGDDERSDEFSNRWAYIDYRWLEAGARRAEMQMRRGNHSASLVIAYCQRQTDYVPPEEASIDDTLAILVREYRPVLDELMQLRKRKVAELTPPELRGDMWIYANHHAEIIDRMVQMKQLAFVENSVKKNIPSLKIESDYGKSYVNLAASSWDALMDEDGKWPLFLKVWSLTKGKSDAEKFGMAICYCPGSAHQAISAQLHAVLETVFPELKKGKKDAICRKLAKQKSVDEVNVEAKVCALFEQANAAVKEALR